MELQSEFGALAAAIDHAENLAQDRRGGPTVAISGKIAALEQRLEETRPERRDDFAWLARRLARAIENGWCREAVGPLVRLARSA